VPRPLQVSPTYALSCVKQKVFTEGITSAYPKVSSEWPIMLSSSHYRILKISYLIYTSSVSADVMFLTKIIHINWSDTSRGKLWLG